MNPIKQVAVQKPNRVPQRIAMVSALAIYAVLYGVGKYRRMKAKGRIRQCSPEIGNLIMYDEDNPQWLQDLNAFLEKGFGSALLVSASFISIMIANWQPASDTWLQIWTTKVGPPVGNEMLTARDWVNEALMALFFFSVGLEIKFEVVKGSLSTPRRALLPCIAALGGMITPMLVYALCNMIMPGGSLAGICVPMATDIAFSLGVFTIIRNHMPPIAKPFLLALATVDDLGSIAVIGVLFTGTLDPIFLVAAVATLVATDMFSGYLDSSLSFIAPGVVVWYFLRRGGISADVAGVFVAMCVPMRNKDGEDMVEPMIQWWNPFCAIVILPIFALCNCAIRVQSATQTDEVNVAAVPIGVMAGLILGKPLGIFGFSYLSIKMGITRMPKGLESKYIFIVGMLGSIGFTMCLFLIEKSLTGMVAEYSKLAVVSGSLISAACTTTYVKLMVKPRMATESEKMVTTCST